MAINLANSQRRTWQRGLRGCRQQIFTCRGRAATRQIRTHANEPNHPASHSLTRGHWPFRRVCGFKWRRAPISGQLISAAKQGAICSRARLQVNVRCRLLGCPLVHVLPAAHHRRSMACSCDGKHCRVRRAALATRVCFLICVCCRLITRTESTNRVECARCRNGLLGRECLRTNAPSAMSPR